MKITVKRYDATDHGVFGQLSCDVDPFTCVTLERHDIDIPTGNYPVTIYTSPEHGEVPLLHDVPNRSMIEMHEGNFEHNSKGCILVGKNRAVIEGQDGIADTQDTKKALVDVIKKYDEVTITIV